MKLKPLSKYRTEKRQIIEDYRDFTVMILIVITFFACCYGHAHVEEWVLEDAKTNEVGRFCLSTVKK